MLSITCRPDDQYFLGVVQSSDYESQWQYYTNSSYLHYSHWDPANRPNASSPGCSVVSRSTGNWLMRPADCADDYASVCQFSMSQCSHVMHVPALQQYTCTLL